MIFMAAPRPGAFKRVPILLRSSNVGKKPKIQNSIMSFSLVLKTCCLKNLDFLRTFHCCVKTLCCVKTYPPQQETLPGRICRASWLLLHCLQQEGFPLYSYRYYNIQLPCYVVGFLIFRGWGGGSFVTTQ